MSESSFGKCAQATVQTLPANLAGEALSAAQKRILFLECLHERLRTAAELAQEEARRARDGLIQTEQREQVLLHRLREREQELTRKGKELTELSFRLSMAETQRAAAEAKEKSNGEELSSQFHATKLELQERNRTLSLVFQKLEDARGRVASLEPAHERMFTKILEWHKVAQQQEGEADFDLAEFIAGLRAEVLSLQNLLARSEAREVAALISSARPVAGCIEFTGSKPTKESVPMAPNATKAVSQIHQEPHTPSHGPEIQLILDKLENPTDRPLAERFIQALESKSDTASEWAANRLVDLLGHWAAPLIAAAISSADSSENRVVLLQALSRIGSALVLPIAAKFLADPSAEVRNAALDSCSNLIADRESEWLVILKNALEDPDGKVRRRALVYAASLRGVDPGPICKGLLIDADPTLRRLACASLASTRDVEAILALIQLLLDPDDKVQRTAEATLTQICGPVIPQLSDFPVGKRKEMVTHWSAYLENSRNRWAPQGRLEDPEHLAALFLDEMNEAEDAQPACKKELKDELPDQLLAESQKTTEKRTDMDTWSNRLTDPIPALDQILSIVQSSLRGCTEENLLEEMKCDPEELSRSIDRFIEAGEVIRRGKKLFRT